MMNDLMVFAGGFKGNAGLNSIDIFNTTSQQWSHAKMSVGRTLFDGAALGPYAIFGCGEGNGSNTADILDIRTMDVKTVNLTGGGRKKCAATSVVLATASDGTPLDGKIIIAGGYKSTAVDVWDLRTGTWHLTNMSTSHFYMAAASAGPYSLFCGGLAPSGDTSLCDIYDARGSGTWTTGHLAAPVREISGASRIGPNSELAVFLGGGQFTIFNASTTPPTWKYGNSTPGRSPWCKFGSASVNNRYAVFGGGNGNTNSIEMYDSMSGSWLFAKHNLSLGREQVMGAGTSNGMVGFAGGSIGDYNPTGYTDRVDTFNIEDLV